MFYSLPKELAEKWKPAFNLPRCPYEVLRTDKYDSIVCDDMFKLLVWDCYSWSAWQFFQVKDRKGNYRDIPGDMKQYAGYFPLWRLSYSIIPYMKTGLTKKQKITEIYFDEQPNSIITVFTHNTDLKKRPTSFAEQYPDHCTMTDEDTETGYKAFEVEKGRLSFRLTAPYSEERRQAASAAAKKNGITANIVL